MVPLFLIPSPQQKPGICVQVISSMSNALHRASDVMLLCPERRCGVALLMLCLGPWSLEPVLWSSSSQISYIPLVYDVYLAVGANPLS